MRCREKVIALHFLAQAFCAEMPACRASRTARRHRQSGYRRREIPVPTNAGHAGKARFSAQVLNGA